MKYSLYIHIPFCKKKCSYCDFFSVPVDVFDYENIKRLLDSILKEITTKIDSSVDIEFDTVYIGGGTPSVIPITILSNFLNRLWIIIENKLTDKPEITIEANVESCSKDFIKTCLGANINRLSLGVQSFNIKNLQYIGRAIYPENIFNTVYKIREQWQKDFSLDIISGINENYLEDLKKAVLLNPDHLSVYQLTIEKGSELFKRSQKGHFIPPSENLQSKAIIGTEEYLLKNGYNRYEISNFSKKRKQSKHNLKYWNMQSYIGVGPSAVSSHYKKNNLQRITNIKNIKSYVENIENKKSISETEFLNKFDFLLEHYIMGCRLTSGINKKIFKQRFKKNPAFFIPNTLQRWNNEGLINPKKAKQATLNRDGLLFLDRFLSEIYDELLLTD